jgi:hypothetical protein
LDDAICAENGSARQPRLFPQKTRNAKVAPAALMNAANFRRGATTIGAAKVHPQQSGLEHVSADSRPWSAICVDVLLEAENWNRNAHGVSGLARQRRRRLPTGFSLGIAGEP